MSLPTRKLLVGLGTAGAVAAGLGATVSPANAQLQTYRVQIAGGEVISLPAPAGLSLEQLQALFPGKNLVAITAQTPATSTAATTSSAPSTSTGAAPSTAGTAPSTSTSASPGTTTEDEEPPTRTEADEADDDDEPSSGKRGRDSEKSSSKKRKKRKSSDSSSSSSSRGSSDGAGGTPAPAPRTAGGTPTPADPSFSESLPNPTAEGVPNFFIDKFRIPPFLLPIYQAAGIQYGVRWEVLAAINEIETDYGRNLNVSSAGAQGWMQFMPATWKMYGVDANGDGRKDPYNPVDAIFGAARYLKAAGAEKDLRKAIFAYNHADWYVNSVMMRARLVAGLPTDLVGSLSGLTQAQFPVYAKARYADAVSKGDRIEEGSNAAQAVESEGSRRAIDIFADAGSPVIAVQDGRVTRIGESEKLGRFVEIRDVYGNTYRYSQLGELATMHAVPKEREVSRKELARELDLPKDPKPERAATAGAQGSSSSSRTTARRASARAATPRTATRAAARRQRLVATDQAMQGKERVFADPTRTARSAAAAAEAPEREREIAGPAKGLERYIVRPGALRQEDVTLKRLKKGSRVVAGSVLGRVGEQKGGTDPHVRFEIRPAGRGAPRIDPKPILDGWKLLETSATYRSKGKNLFFGGDSDEPSVGQILLMSKQQLQRRVLSNPRVEIYECGRRDVRSGAIDRRVLATIEFLSASGLRPTISSMQCGHGIRTSSGNISEHTTGTAMDIAKINGQVISPSTQGRGSITEVTIRKLLTLQGTMKPHQIISLMEFKGEDNTLAMGDHDDHIHVGFRPEVAGGKRLGRQVDAILKPGQWVKLVDRLGDIENPTVRSTPSSSALRVRSAERD